MKLSTGLQPTLRSYAMPPSTQRAVIHVGDGVVTTEVPAPVADVVWVLDLAAARDTVERRLGAHVGTLMLTSKPTVTEHDCAFELYDADELLGRVTEERYRSTHGAPADAVVVDVPLPNGYPGRYRVLRWWEVVA